MNDIQELRAMELRAVMAEQRVARLEAWVETLSDRAQANLKQLLSADPLDLTGRKAMKLEMQYELLTVLWLEARAALQPSLTAHGWAADLDRRDRGSTTCDPP